MIEFEKKIVHVLDCEHNNCILSEKCMDEEYEEILKVLNSKTEKVFHSSARKLGTFQEMSICKKMLQQWKNENINFETFSQQLAQYIFDKKMELAQYHTSDLVIAVIVYENRRYLLILDNACVKGITHNVSNDEGYIKTEIIPYRALISTTLSKKDCAVLIELSDESIYCVENNVEIEAEKVNFYADIILQSSIIPSYKENIKNITKLTEALTEKYDLDEVSIVPKLKSLVVDNISSNTPIQIDEIADEVFMNQPLAKDEFKSELKKQGVPKEIAVENVKPTRSEKVQKIKTDKGIEIIIPVDYMNSKEFVEFHTQPDGTISIQLKNINHISSK